MFSQSEHRQQFSLFQPGEAINSASLIPMNPKFDSEDKSKYLCTVEERRPYLATFLSGKLCDSSGTPLGKNTFLYVLDENNSLYVVPETYQWNHSFFLAGAPVKAAGFIETNNKSKITLISNESGHYTPTLLQMLPALRFFHKIMKNDAVQYESHDDAGKGEIRVYQLVDIVRNITSESSLNKLSKLSISVYLKNRMPDAMQGYDIRIPGSLNAKPFSRYGLAPLEKVLP